ncbi:MAG: LysM peptidoglycan-binding domain-containing protein [Anaerolineales bacterium]|nr:LysM peptidoglycan-binding domain-containing protein [Anaerolineales bacterium]
MDVRTDLKAGQACYTVKSGDNLSYIATAAYGNDPATYNDVSKIYYSNQETIGPNPSLIYPGQKLYIPDVEATQLPA